MLIWRGLGWLAALLILVGYASLDFLSGKFMHDHDYFANHVWPKVAGLWLAALLVFILYLATRSRARNKVEIDTTTGLKVNNRVVDHLFFIRLRWLPLVLIAGGVLVALLGRD